MKIRHLKKTDWTTSVWSGGTTTQFYIYPPEGSYAERRFNIRISSASVDLEESDFTPLPGVDRWIVPLVGGFTLTHPGKAPVVLGPLDEPYPFSGGTPTHCVGRAVDFNLMLKEAVGRMELCTQSAMAEPGISAFYAVSDANFLVSGESYILEAGEMLVIESEEKMPILWDGGLVIACYARVL